MTSLFTSTVLCSLNHFLLYNIQEGGLEPLCRLLLSDDDEVLRETTACLCNLSLGDENKFEITKSGAVIPLAK